MTKQRKIGVAIFAGLAAIYEVAEKTDFVKSRTPKWLTDMVTPDVVLIAIVVLLLVVLFAPSEKSEHSESSSPSSSSGGNSNTNSGNASATGGSAVSKIADNLYLGNYSS